MYLTRMHLNPARRGTRSLVASPQRLHAAVLSGFAPDVPIQSEQGRVLWRLDEGATSLTLYIASPARPDLTHVVEQAGWPTSPDPWQTLSLDPLRDRLAPGQRWAFRLTANPVRSASQPDGDRGKRYGHVTVAQQVEWLASRSSSWGFDVGQPATGVTADVTSRRRLNFERRTDGGQRTVTISTATYDGLLTVVDPASLRQAMGHGLGRAKGYGCGLLTLAPVS
ncbi:type I-E CRISPR-associated protein Cas6/Cse3/CasE [Nocardioides hungaricus]